MKSSGVSLSGLLIVDKEAGMTSHDVVARVRRLLNTRKVGHGGTLDPMATGVLVLGIGKATRLLRWISGHGKTYEASVRLGISTTTDDYEGKVTAAEGCTGVTLESLEEVFTHFRGDISQIPSSVSAIKVNGKRAYALVREGKNPDLLPRNITISHLDVLAAPEARVVTCGEHALPIVDFSMRVQCSSGTYIRALARDMGEHIGSGGHLTALRRTHLGVFSESDAYLLHDLSVPEVVSDCDTALTDNPSACEAMIGLDDAVRKLFPVATISEDAAARFSHGQPPDMASENLEEVVSQARGEPFALIPPGSQTVMGLVHEKAGKLATVLVF